MNPGAASPGGAIAFGPFVLDAAAARLSRDGQALDLAPRPLALLHHLACHPGQLITKDALLDAVWGHRHVTESALKGAMNTLRKVLDDAAKAPLWIETVPRRGYRFIAVPTLVDGAPPTTSRPPLPPSALLGRDAELPALRALLDAHRLVTVVGSGGVGKTHLALAAVADDRTQPSDGAWFVALDGLSDGDALVATIARALRLSAEAACGAETLATALVPQALLLVLDNCEHLLDSVAPLVRLLLARAPGLRVLATSQEPLHLPGEQVMRLAPLACPPGGAQAQAEDYGAVALFVQRLRAQDAAFVLDDGNRADVCEICVQLDGLPLALELAAARVPLLGVHGVRARLSQRLALLSSGTRPGSARQRTLIDTLEWSHGLLSSPQAVVLRRLSVFAGSFSLAAAQEVAADAQLSEWDVLEAVGALQDKSLLVALPLVAGAPPRLRLYDSIRSFAAEHLEAAGEVRALRRRHAAWMRGLLAEASRRAHAEPALDWTARLLPETDNLRAALGHALAASEGDTAVALFAHAAVFWQRAGLKHEAARWLGAVRGFVDDGLPPALRADFLQAETLLCVFAMVGTPSAVEGALDEALRLHRQAGDALAEYLDLYLKAQLLQRLHHGTDPAPIRVRMVALEAADWSILQRRLARWVGGLWLRDCGEAEAYRRFCLEEIGHHRDAGDQHGAWTASQGLGLAEHDRGHLGAAAAQLGATVREIRAAGHLRQYPAIVGLHACLLLEQGDLPAQLPQVLEAVQLLRVDGTLWCMAGALPLAPLARGDDQGAARVLGWADETVRRLGESPGPFFARLRAGCETRLRQSLTDAALQALRDEGALLDEAGALRLALSDA